MAISKIIADSITDEAVTSAKIAQGTVVAADAATTLDGLKSIIL